MTPASPGTGRPVKAGSAHVPDLMNLKEAQARLLESQKLAAVGAHPNETVYGIGYRLREDLAA